MIENEPITTSNGPSESILFASVETPPDAYTALTESVYTAMDYPDYSMVDIENLPRDTRIGTASYENGEVTTLTLYDWVLEEFGFTA